jgi:diketogulonate reductase-like aldo/keto reductase
VTTIPTYELNDGHTIPAIGFGTWPLRGREAVDAVNSALEVGYRLVDTAVNYDNEADVGEAVRTSGLRREDVFVTSKLPGRHHGYDDAIGSVEESLGRMGLDHLDLHLIHWPNPSVGKYVEAWRALIECRERGLVRSIGVSNFTPAHLERIIAETGVTPAVNQVELHPYFPQVEQLQAHAAMGIRTSGWSPLGKRNAPYREPVVVAAAERTGATPAQVVLRWHVQRGSLPIPKSATPSRQVENLDVFGFELTDDEVAAITALGRPDGRLFGGDPDRHEEM